MEYGNRGCEFAWYWILLFNEYISNLSVGYTWNTCLALNCCGILALLCLKIRNIQILISSLIINNN